jgi:hypothetical protein
MWTMSETVTVLLAAFLGGLAGAVLQPVVSHVLERIRSDEETRRRRHQSLRFMLEVEIDWGNYLVMASKLALLQQGIGAPVSFEQKRNGVTSGLAMFRKGVPAWNPERVDDQQLQQLAIEYSEGVRNLAEAYYHPVIDKDKAQALSERLDDMALRIRQRMDELNWPETDFFGPVVG